MNGDHNLFEVVRALHPTGGLAGRLNRREKQTDQNPNNSDNNQKFDEREASSSFNLGGVDRAIHSRRSFKNG
jgi:hypothetical protein